MITPLESALAYAARGWYVLPVEPGGKVPVTSLVPHGHLDATLDEATIRAWWAEHPSAGVAVSLEPSGLVALDVDVQSGKGGDASLAQIDHQLEPTLTARTGSGGLHAVYARPSGVEPARLIRFLPGLDLLGRGYIVVEPSTHPTGGQYRWVNDLPIAPLPDFLSKVAASRPHRARAAAPAGEPHDYPPASQELLALAKEHLRAHGPSIRHGGGDQKAYRVGAILLNDYALSWDEAWALAVWWNMEFPENEWSLDKLETKLRNGGRYATGERGFARLVFDQREWFSSWARPPEHAANGHSKSLVASLAEPEIEHEPGTWEHDLAVALRDVRAALGSVDAEEAKRYGSPLFEPSRALFGATYPETPWLVEQLVTEGGVTGLATEPKAAKTWLGTEIAVAVASGTRAMGQFATRKRRVAYFYAEDMRKQVHNRLRALFATRVEPRDELCELLHVQPRGKHLDITKDEDLAWLLASCRRLPELGLLVMDPLRDLHSGEEDKSDSMREVMRRFRMLADALGCTVLFVHHSAKASADSAKRRGGQKMRGSSAIHGSLDCGIYLSGLVVDQDGRVFTNIVESEVKGARGAGYFKLTLTIEDDANGEAVRAAWRVERETSGNGLSGRPGMDLEAMSTFAMALWSEPGRCLVRKQLRDGRGIGGARFDAAIEKMEELGLVRQKMRGKMHCGWELTPAGERFVQHGELPGSSQNGVSKHSGMIES